MAPPDPTAVLVVDDDEEVLKTASEALRRGGYEPVMAASATQAHDALANSAFPAAVVDIFLPDGRGLDLITEVHERDPQAVAIVVTGYASLDTALAALRLGAYEYLCKPFTGDQLLRALRRGLERRELILSNLRLASELGALAARLQAHRDSLQGQVGRVEASLEAFRQMAERLALAGEATSALQVLCETAGRLSGAAAAAVLASRADGFEVAAAHDPSGRLTAGRILSASPLLAEAQAARSPTACDDLLLGAASTDDALAGMGYGSAFALPVRVGDRVIGLLLCVAEATRGFGEETASLLRLVASHASLALSRWLEEPPGADAAGGFIGIDRLL